MGSRPRFLVLNPSSLDLIQTHRPWLESLGIELLGETAFKQLEVGQLDRLLENVQAVIGPGVVSVQARHMAAHASLQVISLASSGYESEDLAAATQHGIVVCNAPLRSLAEVVADLTWGLLLSVARQIPYHHQQLQAGNRQRGMGAGVWGKTLGVVGLGNVGRAVARRALGFEMRVLASDPAPDEAFVRQHGIQLVSLEELLRQADFVSLHVRLSRATERLIGARELGLMKPSAYLINTARQQLVDEAALTRAILSGGIAGAALDDPPQLPDSPLLGLPNVVFTPHLGNRVQESVEQVCRAAYLNAIDVLHGRRPAYVVNPEVYRGGLRAPYPEIGVPEASL